jgi:carbon storage regulator
MLVLSRKPGEAIVLAGNITIQVLSIEHDRVKLGVDAPPDVLVLRSELVPGYEPPAAVVEQLERQRERDEATAPRPLRSLRPLPRRH